MDSFLPLIITSHNATFSSLLCQKSPDKGNLREKGLIWTHSSRGIQYTLEGKTWQEAEKAWYGSWRRRLEGHLTSRVKKQNVNRIWDPTMKPQVSPTVAHAYPTPGMFHLQKFRSFPNSATGCDQAIKPIKLQRTFLLQTTAVSHH